MLAASSRSSSPPSIGNRSVSGCHVPLQRVMGSPRRAAWIPRALGWMDAAAWPRARWQARSRAGRSTTATRLRSWSRPALKTATSARASAQWPWQSDLPRRDRAGTADSGAARLCSEQRLSTGEAQLALAALNALPGPGARSGVQSLAAVCETHGLGREVQVLQSWLSRR